MLLHVHGDSRSMPFHLGAAGIIPGLEKNKGLFTNQGILKELLRTLEILKKLLCF